MSLPLALGAVAAPRTYKLTTTSFMRMNEAEERNVYHTVARQTLLERKPNNTYRLAIDVLSFEAENRTFFNSLAADLNRVSNALIVQTDIYGRLDRVENKGEMLDTWQRIRSGVSKKYEKYYPKAFFEAFGQNMQKEGVFEKTIRHKGLHGVLLPGIYGYGYTPDVPVPGTRVLEQFINQVSLPLQITTKVVESQAPNHLTLEVVGTLNQEALQEDDLRRLFRTMADNPLLKVNMHVNCMERYTLEAATGWLLQAEQRLEVAVPGIYQNNVHHTLETVG
ncbi:hypothetical protein J0X19_14175 [Hymenobacter sp. BT186]|uniref:Uncharacterized protein n=1 Tax=Hymenobacter telluris TaxID=2816474 RepID=A0A939EX85_9BACT|nr:hypothetical protein [Hymenobacter telluris]MBO0359103.1 hypothetical protein [Hymenobacter telluris]MBW3375129.1 hypothetical protein [Hymenobacter norwichensis]